MAKTTASEKSHGMRAVPNLRACLHGGGGPQVGEVTRLSISSLILI